MFNRGRRSSYRGTRCCNKLLAYHVKAEDRLLIIPFATEEFKVDRWFKFVRETFDNFGIHHIKLLDYQLSNEAMQNEIESHNILFFTGGRPEKLMERLLTKGLVHSIKSFSGIMVGVSAGALVFSKNCLITKDDDYPQTQVIKGLELVDFCVEVHYDENIDRELLFLSANQDIYAIPNGSAIMWEEQIITPINNIFYFSKGTKHILT
ncbi:Type 1 glutamine amidotransferase-like domain-containing protein [Cytobacillus sp. Hm23]